MARWFVGNFHFEHRLADPSAVLSGRLQRLDAELAAAWLAVADDGDVVWTPRSIPAEFWDAMAARGFPRLQPATDWRGCPPEALLVPWGWTPELCACRSAQQPPDPQVVRRLNSRRWSAELELAGGTALPGASICCSLEEVVAAIARLPGIDPMWVIKAEFGMSGRERCLGRGPLTTHAASWTQRRLRRDGVVFLEPWVAPVEEAGLLWEVPRRASPQLVGVVPMHVDEHGHYRGSWFRGTPPYAGDLSDQPEGAPMNAPGAAQPGGAASWDEAVAATAQVAEMAQRAGYHGPLGIDVMRYRDASGAVRLRPLQDVNARWTMGRLALGWRRWFADQSWGLWWHGPAHELDRGPWAALPEGRVIHTSPGFIDNQPAQLASAVVVRI
jgi:hypothetical protein